MRAAALAACGVLLLAAACQMPPHAARQPPKAGEIDPTVIETRDDITEIVQYWKPMPWLYDSDRRPVGFQATVYFVSGATDRGAFVPGQIMVWLYGIEPQAEGMPQRKPLYGWEFDQRDSMLYRVRKTSIQGYYYGFPLMWGPEVDVIGREIEVVFGYQRLDGRILTAPGQRFQVPVPPGYRRPSTGPAREPGRPPETQPAPAYPSRDREGAEPFRRRSEPGMDNPSVRRGAPTSASVPARPARPGK